MGTSFGRGAELGGGGTIQTYSVDGRDFGTDWGAAQSYYQSQHPAAKATGASPARAGSSTVQSAAQATTAADPWGVSGGRATAIKDLKGIQSNDPATEWRDKLIGMMGGVFKEDDPSYQWRLAQGNQAVERSLASRGMLDSGGAVAEIMQMGQGMASQEYSAQFGRLLSGMTGVEAQYSSQMNNLMKLAGIEVPSVGVSVGQRQTALDQGQQQINLSGQQQQWGQDVAGRRDIGIGDAISRMYSDNLYKNFLSNFSAYSSGIDSTMPDNTGWGYSPGYSSSIDADRQGY